MTPSKKPRKTRNLQAQKGHLNSLDSPDDSPQLGTVLAITGAVGDVVDAAVWFGLATTVISILGAEAFGEQGAGKLSASSLAINVVVGVDKVASRNCVAHGLALCYSVNETIGLVIVCPVWGLDSSCEPAECLSITVTVDRGWVWGRRQEVRAMEAVEGKQVQNKADKPISETN